MFAPIDQDRLFYLRYGRGLPLLVMHGGPGLSHAYFRPYLDALGQTAELIYYDHRGNGRSSGREAVGEVSLEQWADDAEALRLALKLGPVVAMGHGFGAFVAQAYARRHPQSVRGLVLVSGTPTLDYPARMLAGVREAGGEASVAAVMRCMSQPMGDDEAWRREWTQALPAFFHRFQPMYGQALSDGLGFCAAAYNRGMFSLGPTFSSLPWLHELRMPALVVGGQHDWWAPAEEAVGRLAAGLPAAQAQVFAHSGHYPFVEETTAFCHVVRAFLRRL
jgi:proline iminopeptidase